MTIKQEKSPIRYFMYCRKSTESEDRQVLSLPAQLDELNELAKRQGLTVVDRYAESQSAFKDGRPYFNEMLSRIEQGEADGILVWATNRIARNMLDGGRVIHFMDSKLIREIRTPGMIFTNTPEHKFSLSLEFSMAKKSSDDLGVAVRRGNRQKFKSGRWVGIAKPGYLNFTDSVTRNNYLDVDPERFPLLQNAIHLILDGTHTPMEALHVLNDDWGYKSKQTKQRGGGPLSKTSWYRVLNDTFYFGLMKWNNQEMIGNHQPMLSEEEFELLQIRLGKQGKSHYTKHKYPYKSVLKCGECGGSITCQEKWHIVCDGCKHKFARSKRRFDCPKCYKPIVDMQNPTIRHYLYYSCTKKVCPDCSQGSLEIHDLEATILAELERFEIPEAFANWAIEHLHEVMDQQEQVQNHAHDNLVKELDRNDQQIKRLMRLRVSVEPSTYTSDLESYYDEEQKRLFDERKRLEKRLQSYDADQEKWAELTKETFNFACHARYWFENGTMEEKTKILETLGENLTIKDRKLCIQGKKPFFLIEKCKKDIAAVVAGLEPSKKIDDPNYLITLEPVQSLVRRGQDLNLRGS